MSQVFQLSFVLCNQNFFIQGSFNIDQVPYMHLHIIPGERYSDRFHYTVLKAAISSHNILNLASYLCLKYIFSFSSDSWSFGWYPISTCVISFDVLAS